MIRVAGGLVGDRVVWLAAPVGWRGGGLGWRCWCLGCGVLWSSGYGERE